MHVESQYDANMTSSLDLQLQNFEFSYITSEDEETHQVFSLRVPFLTFQEGERVLIAGPSGSGKTTLFRVITGLIPAIYQGNQKGEVWLGKKALVEYSPGELFTILSLIPQMLYFAADTPYTITEVIRKLENQGKSPEEIEQFLQWATQILDLTRHAWTPPQFLSVGEQQLLSLLRAVGTEFTWLIMDEPFSALDISTKKRVIDRLTTICQKIEEIQGKRPGMLIFSHDALSFLPLVERVIFMEKGKIKWDKSSRELELKDLKELIGDVPPFIEDHKEIRNIRQDREAVSVKRSTNEGSLKTEKKEESYHALQLQNFTVQYSNQGVSQELKQVFRRLDIECIQKRVTLLIGKTGSGKTTILHRLARLEHEDKGELKWMTPQRSMFLDKLDSREFAAIIDISLQNPLYEMNSWKNSEQPGLFLEYLKKLGIADLIHRDPRTYSAGELKRYSVARALSRPVPVILLDEPTANLDPQSRARMIQLLAEVNQYQQKTLIVSSHDVLLWMAFDSNSSDFFHVETQKQIPQAKLRWYYKEYLKKVEELFGISREKSE